MKSHEDPHRPPSSDRASAILERLAFAIASVALALLAGACDPGLAHSSVPPPITHNVLVFVDRSRSIGADQYERWNGLAAARLVRPDTRVTVLTISDVTGGAAALADVQLPLPDRRA